MIYRFDPFELDVAGFELRRDGTPVPIEPQVLSLLALLVANRDRMVSKDEIIEKIWNNRAVSDAAVASRIKSARKAIADDGQQQRLVRTIHGRGFRFVGEVIFAGQSSPSALSCVLKEDAMADRPSIAVLPFRLLGDAGPAAFLTDALADELIADLSHLRWLFVIARGSSFRFRDSALDHQQIGHTLGVRYCLTGSIALAGEGVFCAVELIEAASGGVIWAEHYEDRLTNIHDMRREIAANVVAALENSISLYESRLARGRDISQLSAWSAYHAGLDHMFRFNRADNELAARMFDRAFQVNPEFPRAYAGKSFTHFQNAFLGYQSDHGRQVDAAHELAQRAVQLDRLDSFCHFNMGRALWLSGDLAGSLDWLEQATQISPSYAQGVYSKAWARTLSGAPEQGEKDALLALRLSPLDPLRYAMIATCALSHVLRGNHEEAVVLAERAVRSPGAHKHIAVIAAIATYLADRRDRSRQWVAAIHQNEPQFRGRDFLRSFPFATGAAREMIERALVGIGL
ncbi:Adenylate cyclase cya3 (Sinorhizobium meliloti) [Sphingobium herbicidovorans NBRC 16415]|uniref:Adenylate cyclase cya3 (Sinorhizobium meliloti) n=1 Tax=Sphingobium herbicidovorans (strain ATCC 700291 / DSM 11019 / CCUG 56400 / KCTC 2939 / LMG 18315 / NBRC 16415 / MH) TaxID=1219045 RepID=A0A086PBU8_SPHHM|nr:winged helix-turn-helix domain-containing protein [Sphingobium herbicidovorans]KFG90866.1 Adenylate cyclase cya3 (Sinorhizobium meliloti) [Sphingobium herbicidovorans NBRC 16415]